MADMGITWFIEAGPGNVLGKLAGRAAPGSTVRFAGSPAEARAIADDLQEPARAAAEEGR
jgi:malonyl CoA-acyl carrier protein transacylase